MNLENSIKDAITKKLEDGTIETLVQEQLEKGVTNALNNMFQSYGDVTKVIETKIKSVVLPYIEGYDYSRYIVKLDTVLVEVLKSTAFENSKLLMNFKELMLVEDRKVIKASELFEIWKKHVAENVEIDGLSIHEDEHATYEAVEVTFEIEKNNRPSWSIYNTARLIFECEHDKTLNFELQLSQYEGLNESCWTMLSNTDLVMSSLRRLDSFQVLMMRLGQAGTKLEIDRWSDSDEITPDKEPELSYS